MVPRYVHHTCATIGEGNDLAQYFVVTCWPQERTFHGLQIHRVTHQIKGVKAGFVEKIQQDFCFAFSLAQVDVRQPGGIVLHSGFLFYRTLVSAGDREEAVSRNFDDMAAFQWCR